ncbi:MAG: hypothetical protein Ta2B_11860 [Termitinemataceae bacterium]|nr:MAG: hypothetical protein Ta2B_11860 [Termitinemataceae bacterium]
MILVLGHLKNKIRFLDDDFCIMIFKSKSMWVLPCISVLKGAAKGTPRFCTRNKARGQKARNSASHVGATSVEGE